MFEYLIITIIKIEIMATDVTNIGNEFIIKPKNLIKENPTLNK